MTLLLLYTVLFQVGNNYIVNLINPYTAFFVIYFLSSLIFVGFNYKRNFYKLDKAKYSVPMIILGQVASPFFYFKGVFLSDILTQSMLYALYPLTIIVFSKIYDKEKLITKKNLIIYLVIIFQMLILVKNIQINEGFYYLLISCILLISHKIIHKIAIKKEGEINEYSITFYGLFGSAILGAILLLTSGQNLLDSFSFFKYINLETNKGLLFLTFFIFVVFLLGKIQFKRNSLLNKNKFEELYLFIIIMPPFAVMLNNYLYFIDNKTEINFSIFGIEGLLYLLLFIIVKLDWRIILSYITSCVLFYALITNQFLIDVKPFQTDIFKVVYSDVNKIGIVKKDNNQWIFEKNEKDYDIYQFIENKVDLYKKLEFQDIDTGRPISIYFKDFIASDDSMVVYDTNTYKKYIFKDLEPDIYEKMVKFKPLVESKDYLVDYDLLKDNNGYYIITDFIDGVTFEDYFGQYDINFIKRINQKDFINSIIKVSELNLDLMKNGWINRDSHQNNILITEKGIIMIDYDLVFELSKNEGVIDSNGFKNNLYDMFRFFYPKRDIIKNKFLYQEEPPLKFKYNASVINENLIRMNKYIHDNSYIYSDECEDKEIKGMESFIKDLKNIEKPYEKIEVTPTNIQAKCVNHALFYKPDGSVSFEVFNLPSKYFDFNYIELNNYEESDLNFFVNATINYSLQQNSTTKYLINKDDIKSKQEIERFLKK